MKPFMVIILGILFIGIDLPAQPGHFFHCVSVQNNQDILLEWEAPELQAQFSNYEVYHSNSQSGGFSLLATIYEVFTTTWVHQNVNPTINPNYYYIKLNLSGPPPVLSDTLQAVKLRVIPSPDKDVARLDWNSLHAPRLPSTLPWYYIYRKYSFGNWEIIDSTLTLLYNDTIRVCDDTINYRIELKDEMGCSSVSNISGAWLNDLTAPPVPVLDSVSINQDEFIIMGWEVSPDPGTVDYIIYKNVNGIWGIQDTVNGRYTTSYIDTLPDVCSRTHSYGIAAIDSCGNTSPRGISPEAEADSIRSIYLKNIHFDPCESSNRLNWSKYINMVGGLAGYNIYVKINQGNFQLLSMVDTNYFLHENLPPGTIYSYFIRAVNQDGSITSTSCTKSATTFYPALPAFIYLRKATVINNADIELTCYIDTNAIAQGFKIFRSFSPSGPFAIVDTLYPTGEEMLYYVDNTVNVAGDSYFYFVTEMDSCWKDDLESNFGRSVRLSIDRTGNESYSLHWNAYEEWDGTVKQYDLYRKLHDGTEILYQTLGSGTFDFQFTASDDDYSFFVEAIEDAGGSYPFTDTSRSNTVLLQREPEVYLPNAFAPKGLNNSFKPVMRFMDGNEYNFMIFSRWGQTIFATSDPDASWDGRFEGNYVPLGTYAYVVIYSDGENTFEKRGTVTVVF